ncbi:hypothetical protein LOK49_LG14G01756 [Camellia lanceoleosa]|uniref:Uncharacterized protein n=1 Tax=Camellia lanceoleosa TaxID=1840588 RepID=A0ACC0FAK9_9ERIC|nr:hypothetical protein LOK49_LG14G01756 [Camellia lanceoleosa]
MRSLDPWISFKYENLSDFCYDCGRIGHDRNVCVEIANFHSAARRSVLAEIAVGPSLGVRSGPYGFGLDMPTRPQYFVTEPVETIGPMTKDTSSLSKVHSGGPLEIEEVSPATSPVCQDLKTRVIDDCISIVFNCLSLKKKARESDLHDASQLKLFKCDGLTTIPIKTIEFPSTFTQISLVVPNSGTMEKVRKIERRRRRSGDKGLVDVEVALVESLDAQEAQSLLVCSSLLVDECCSQVPSTFPFRGFFGY